MAFARLTLRESLRDIEAYLGVQPAKLYHLGFRASVLSSTDGRKLMASPLDGK
jgi:hypothetical protein